MKAKTALRIISLLVSGSGATKHVVRLVRDAGEWWSGRKIAIIGPTGSGKDSFLARLQNQEIPEDYSSTLVGNRSKAFKVKLTLSTRQVVDITCKGVINMGGGTEHRDAPLG